MPILRQTPFGNVQTGHHFDPDNELLMKPSRKFEGVEHQTINAVANSCLVTAGLDMYVAGSQPECLLKDEMLYFQQRRIR